VVIGSGFAATFRDALAKRDAIVSLDDDLFSVEPDSDAGL
jgi:hypothetical protein